MTLYLTCGLCGRKQADGLLSRGAWGQLDVSDGVTLRACPTCKTSNSDWQSQLSAGANTAHASGGQSAYGIAQ
jgi:hypothetical protein